MSEYVIAPVEPTPEILDSMEETYMPFGEMRAAYDGMRMALKVPDDLVIVRLDEAMVERVARAIVESTSGPFELISREGQEAARDEARAAITAMKEGV